ncbi:MAG: hypothetical protein ACLQVY_22495 [Limisphaerales bacterium]
MTTSTRPKRGQLLLLFLLLGGALAVLCHRGFLPYEVFFANDSALGALKASSERLPYAFTGCWADFWWLGGAPPSPSLTLSTFLATVLSPEHYLKVYVPLTAFFFGFCVWFFFRQLRFSALASVLTGVGAGLNMHFFSNACWGLGTWTVCCGMVFVALGIIVSPYVKPLWIKGALAGLSVGMVVMEGFDVGAILSVYVGVFVAFFFLITEPKLSGGVMKTLEVGAVVVFFAFFISASTLFTLVDTQISGTPTAGENEAQKQGHWDFTTQWSIPKLESLRVIIPGLFGYRMEEFTTSTNKAGSYWGRIAEDPRVEPLESGDSKTRAAAVPALGQFPPDQLKQIQDVMSGNDVKARASLVDQLVNGLRLQRRHTGSGEFTGVLVCLLAIFGLANAGRRSDSPYTRPERAMIWFWTVAAILSLFAAWGRHGSIYRFIYNLPYFANIRNPMKFMHPLNISLIILCGFGLEALWRRYLRPAPNAPSAPAASSASNRPGSSPRRSGSWWQRFAPFDKGWFVGTVFLFILSVVAYVIMAGSKPDLIDYLEHHGFDATLAPQIAGFSIGEVGLFVLFFALSAGTIITILTGVWAGKKVVWAWVFLGTIMICDLARADAPWIRYFNYQQKYSMNPVVNILRHDPWEHRVVSRFSPMGAYDIVPDGNTGALCHWWLENDYPYNEIECLEIDQAPRMPILDSSYLGNFVTHSIDDLTPAARQWASSNARDNPLWNWVVEAGCAARLWRLTNTRYIFGDARLTDVLNQYADPPNSFTNIMRMDMVTKPGVAQVEDAGDMTVQTNSQGPIALIEYTRALPRAKLYASWRMVDDPTALQTLDSQGFDPGKTVLVATNTPAPPAPASPGADAGTVKITHYEPKDMVLQADAKTPAVLLLNNRTGSGWSVWVDQKPAEVLRCNYVMRGVFLPPGNHTVEFRFKAPLKYLYISLAATAMGLLLSGYVIRLNCGRSNPKES